MDITWQAHWPTDDGPWELYASADEESSPNPLRFFGPLGFATQDRTAKRVVRVLLSVAEHPEPGDYWAWLDLGASQPSCIAATEQEMTKKFLLDQLDAPGPREEEQVGQGRILRLRVSVLDKVDLPAGRRRWSSAM